MRVVVFLLARAWLSLGTGAGVRLHAIGAPRWLINLVMRSLLTKPTCTLLLWLGWRPRIENPWGMGAGAPHIDLGG